jgi:hypothetical protein
MKHLLVVLSLLGAATAQGRSPLPGLPMTPPPVDHPALGAQPLFQEERPQQPPAPPSMGPAAPAPAPDPAIAGPKRMGKDLKKAVARVADLEWKSRLTDARIEAAAQDKPILWLQALGDLEGFA